MGETATGWNSWGMALHRVDKGLPRCCATSGASTPLGEAPQPGVPVHLAGRPLHVGRPRGRPQGPFPGGDCPLARRLETGRGVPPALPGRSAATKEILMPADIQWLIHRNDARKMACFGTDGHFGKEILFIVSSGPSPIHPNVRKCTFRNFNLFFHLFNIITIIYYSFYYYYHHNHRRRCCRRHLLFIIYFCICCYCLYNFSFLFVIIIIYANTPFDPGPTVGQLWP